jgi:hypothetical protein
MSVNNGDQGNIWATNVGNVKPGFASNQGETAEGTPALPEKEVTRESLYDMVAFANQTLINNKKTSFKGKNSTENFDSDVQISPERLSTVTEEMKPFLKSRPSVVMRASALGDFAFSGAIKEKLVDPYAKAALIEFAAAQELAASEAN